MLYPKPTKLVKARPPRVPPKVALEVLERDKGCVAPRLGGSFMDCWGRNTIAHVKVAPRMGRKAEPLAGRLVTICQGHMEDGTKGGYCWVTDAANIAKLRDYLEKFRAA